VRREQLDLIPCAEYSSAGFRQTEGRESSLHAALETMLNGSSAKKLAIALLAASAAAPASAAQYTCPRLKAAVGSDSPAALTAMLAMGGP
jgi:hypothetical protein